MVPFAPSTPKQREARRSLKEKQPSPRQLDTPSAEWIKTGAECSPYALDRSASVASVVPPRRVNPASVRLPDPCTIIQERRRTHRRVVDSPQTKCSRRSRGAWLQKVPGGTTADVDHSDWLELCLDEKCPASDTAESPKL